MQKAPATLPLLFILALLLASCSGNVTIVPGSSKPVDKRLFGEWRNESIRVECPTHRGTDTTYVLNVPVGQWETAMNMKPIRTTYKADGNYTSEYRTLSDSISLRRQGTWTANGKRLIMRETEPDTREYTYDYKISGSRITFRTTLDFDKDGSDDDKYVGVQKKQ